MGISIFPQSPWEHIVWFPNRAIWNEYFNLPQEGRIYSIADKIISILMASVSFLSFIFNLQSMSLKTFMNALKFYFLKNSLEGKLYSFAYLRKTTHCPFIRISITILILKFSQYELKLYWVSNLKIFSSKWHIALWLLGNAYTMHN